MKDMETGPLPSNSLPQNTLSDQNQATRNFTDKFVIRLPKGLRDSIALIAKNNRRSMNSEIVMLIEKEVSKNFDDSASKPSSINKAEILENNLNSKEITIIKSFRKLSAPKQKAIITLMG